jgi:Rrf2 family cysteine metabolism transcriptional repressor
MTVVTNQELVSKKCQYALRAIFELALGKSTLPMKIQKIAAAQDIPLRFLEVILVELKQGGFVSSKRGNSGGYVLARRADDIVVGEVIGFFEGGWSRTQKEPVPRKQRVGDLAFSHLWNQVKDAISQIYDQLTFQDLLDEEVSAKHPQGSNYVI